MSVNRSDYVVYGINLGKFDEDTKNLCNLKGESIDLDEGDYYLYQDERGKDGYVLVLDGMSGEYAVFGKLLAYGEEFEGIPLTCSDLSEEDKKDVVEKTKELFGIINCFPKIISFSHFH